MRLSITIFFLLLGFAGQTNLPSAHLCVNIEVVKTESEKKNVEVEITSQPTETQEVKKGVQNSAVHILNSILKVSFASKETRHFLDGFFISFFSYFTSYKNYTTDNHDQHVAIDKKLAIVYPFHSFW